MTDWPSTCGRGMVTPSLENGVKVGDYNQGGVLGTLIAMVGLPRSGKSTVARELSRNYAAPIVSKDSIRLAMHGHPYLAQAEPMVKAVSKTMVHALFISGHEFVIADETHYSREAREFMKDGPWATVFYEVTTPMDVCIQRALETNQHWLPDVIRSMASRYTPLDKDDATFIYQPDSPMPVLRQKPRTP